MASMMTDDRIKKIINTAAAASLGLFLCACGNSASSAIEEGMNKVALQEYDAAIEKFNYAMKLDEESLFIQVMD